MSISHSTSDFTPTGSAVVSDDSADSSEPQQLPPSVFAVDDDADFLGALGDQVGSAGWPFHGFATAESFLEGYQPEQTGCVLLDIRLPGASGIELQARMLELGYPIPVIGMSGLADVGAAVQILKAGAIDFLQKPLDHPALLNAIDHAVGQDRERRVQLKVRDSFSARHDLLTPRESEVLRLIFRGESTREIADGLHVSRRTVEKHRERIMRKMEADSASSLILMAVKAGVFSTRQLTTQTNSAIATRLQ